MKRKWLWLGGGTIMGLGTTLAVTLSGPTSTLHQNVFAASNTSSTVSTGPTWGSRSLASLAEGIAAGSHDARPSSAQYFVTNRGKGNMATSGDRTRGHERT